MRTYQEMNQSIENLNILYQYFSTPRPYLGGLELTHFFRRNMPENHFGFRYMSAQTMCLQFMETLERLLSDFAIQVNHPEPGQDWGLENRRAINELKQHLQNMLAERKKMQLIKNINKSLYLSFIITITAACYIGQHSANFFPVQNQIFLAAFIICICAAILSFAMIYMEPTRQLYPFPEHLRSRGIDDNDAIYLLNQLSDIVSRADHVGMINISPDPVNQNEALIEPDPILQAAGLH